MKKETVLLVVVIAFLVGFISGATVAILKGTKSVERPAMVQKPQTPLPVPQGPDPIGVSSAIQSLKDIVKKEPKNLSAWKELGNLYFEAGEPKEAIDAYRQYLAINPNNPDVRTDMGIMYRALGDFDRAIEEFKKAAKSDPKHINSRYNIGIVLLHDKGDVIGAIQAWEGYLKVDPNSERAQRVRAQMGNLKKMAQ